jgi:hypothetical protein
MQMQPQMQRRLSEDMESERRKGREKDRIWAKKVLLISGVIILFTGMLILYVDVVPIYAILVKIYEYIASYMMFSQRVICDIVSFIIGIVFMLMFTMVTIMIVLLCSIPFLACIFAFTDI